MHDLEPAAREMSRLVYCVTDDQLGDPTPCLRSAAVHRRRGARAKPGVRRHDVGAGFGAGTW
jgi:hypothetical protein